MKKVCLALASLLLTVFQTASAGAPIGIITAMPKEAAPFLKALKHQQPIRMDGILYHQGTWHNHQVIVVSTGIGKVSAAAVTATLITHFKPQLVLFSGIAGGLSPKVGIGAIVIGDPVYSVEHYTEVHDENFDTINPLLKTSNPITIAPDKNLLEQALALKTNLSVSAGRIATTDIFPTPKTQWKHLVAQGNLAIESEGYAVAFTAKLLHTPALIIRSISNPGTTIDNKHEVAHRLNENDTLIATENAAKFTLSFIQHLSPSSTAQ